MFLDEISDSSGVAADTGSHAHGLVDAWYRSDFDTAAALREVAALNRQFPQADTERALEHFRAYIADPRNRVTLLWAPEETIVIPLPPHETDPTGEPIYITGHIDQVRLAEDGLAYVWDIKTGKPGGFEMVNAYALQIAAYSVGASLKLQRPVHPGGLIRTLSYLKKTVDPASSPPDVFWHMPFDLEGALVLLDGVALRVAQIRRGDVTISPGSQCNYCPAGGIQGCLPKIRNLSR